MIQLQLPLDWSRCDWSYWAPATTNRPTEDEALENVNKQAQTIRKTGGLLDFNDDMWRVYFADLELRFRWQNGRVYPVDIGKQIGYTPERVIACLRDLDDVAETRYELGLPLIPPVPIRHIRKHRSILRIATQRGITIAA